MIDEPKQPAARPRRALWPYAAALILGAGAALYLVVARPEIQDLLIPNARVSGLEARILDQDQALAALTARIQALESASKTLAQPVPASEPAPVTGTPVDLAPLETRLQALEKSGPGAGVEARLGLLERESARLPAIERDLAKLGNLEQEIAKLPQWDKANGVRAAAISALVLVQAVNSGSGFRTELDLAKAHLTTEGAKAALERLGAFADSGIARRDQLILDFPILADAIEAAGEPIDPELSWPWRWLERLKRSIVIRPLNPQSGTTVSAILSRARAAVTAGQLDRAAAEMISLSPADDAHPALAHGAAWAVAAQVRLAADHDLAQLAGAIIAQDGQ
jgi:hypothetical protein